MRYDDTNESDELDQLFDDQNELRLARLLSHKQSPQVEADPAFRAGLRRQLMREAWGMSNPSPSWWRGLFAPRGFAWGGAVAGLVAVACLALLFGYNQLQAGQNPSAQISERPVAATEPIKIRFNTDMDHASVEKAVKVDPPTDVHYQWDGNTLNIVPASGAWAGNVQYKITVDQTAQSTAGKPLTQATTVPVTTEPTPSPTFSPTPTPTATPPPVAGLTDVRQIGSVSADHRFLAWSGDGQAVYVIDAQGRLSAVPTQVGQARSLSDVGVSDAVLSPDGAELAFVRASKVWRVALGAGTSSSVGTPDGPVLALGWREGAPIWATAGGVFGGDGQLERLAQGAQQVTFSPTGDRAAYQSPGGLRVLDLSGGAETSLVQSTRGGAVLAWSPDGKALAYQDGGQVVLLTLGTNARATVAIQTTTGSWSGQGNLLLATGQGLYQVGSDGNGLRMLAQGAFDLVQWGPDPGRLAFVRGNGVWLAMVAQSRPPAALESARAAVDAFMRARLGGSSDGASASLDAAGKSAYSSGGAQLTPSGFSRYYVVAAQDGGTGQRFVVRLVFSNGKFETQFLDETLGLQPDSTGKLLVHSASALPRQDLGKGPLLTAAEFGAGTVSLHFDSDLDARSVASAVAVTNTGGAQAPAGLAFQASRTIVVDTSQLRAGGTYHLVIQTSLKDVAGRSVAVAYPLDFVVVAPAPSSAGGSPSATPAAASTPAG